MKSKRGNVVANCVRNRERTVLSIRFEHANNRSHKRSAR